MTEALVFAGLLIAALVALLLVLTWFAAHQRRLSPVQAKAFWKSFATAEAQTDAHRRVLDAEKVLEAVLRAKGYKGSMADQLRAAKPVLTNEQALWDAHKLRNRIAHDHDVSVNDGTADRAVAAFAVALKLFLGPRP